MENCAQQCDFQDSPETPLYEIITTENKKTYKCLAEKCGKVFRFRSDMERHKIVHTKNRPFACKFPSCGKSFKRPDALKNHLQTHNEGFPYICSAPGCNLRFHKRSALQYHLLKHNDEKFIHGSSCCQKNFLTSKLLNQHKNTTESQQKIAPSPENIKQEDVPSDDVGCFLNHFEDITPKKEPSLQNSSGRNPFNDDEDFSPKSEKFLHTEAGRATRSHSLDSSELCCKLSDINSAEISSKLCFRDFAQLMICKYLLDDNQQMKAKLDIKTDPIKEKLQDRLKTMLKKALGCSFDMSGAISSTD